jgi:excisionase family DNA binding protein
MNTNDPDKTTVERVAFSPGEAALALGLARSSVYAALARGDLRSVRVGGRRLVPRSEIERILADSTDRLDENRG